MYHYAAVSYGVKFVAEAKSFSSDFMYLSGEKQINFTSGENPHVITAKACGL
jgi:hypothetical protein